MKLRPVEFHEEATRDLLALYDWIADAAGPDIALSERGQLREDLRPALRIVGFEKRVTIAFVVE